MPRSFLLRRNVSNQTNDNGAIFPEKGMSSAFKLNNKLQLYKYVSVDFVLVANHEALNPDINLSDRRLLTLLYSKYPRTTFFMSLAKNFIQQQ